MGNGLLARLLRGRIPQVGRSDGWPPRLPREPDRIPPTGRLTVNQGFCGRDVPLGHIQDTCCLGCSHAKATSTQVVRVRWCQPSHQVQGQAAGSRRRGPSLHDRDRQPSGPRWWRQSRGCARRVQGGGCERRIGRPPREEPARPHARRGPVLSVGESISRLAKKTDLVGITLHSLRRMTGTELAAAGVDAAAAARLGHTIEDMHSHYVRPVNDREVAAAAQYNERLRTEDLASLRLRLLWATTNRNDSPAWRRPPRLRL